MQERAQMKLEHGGAKAEPHSRRNMRKLHHQITPRTQQGLMPALKPFHHFDKIDNLLNFLTTLMEE
jgi:hypothetical protein